MYRKYGALSSSVDPQRLSLTIKGLVPLLVLGLPLLGIVDVGENDLIALIDQVGVIVSASVVIYGIGRKFF